MTFPEHEHEPLRHADEPAEARRRERGRRAGRVWSRRAAGVILIPVMALAVAIAMSPIGAETEAAEANDQLQAISHSQSQSPSSESTAIARTTKHLSNRFDGSDEAPGYAAVALPSKDHALAFTVRGVVGEIPVKETQAVAPGDVLVRLKSDLQHWVVEAQRIAAEDDTPVISAKKQLEVARFDLEMLEDAGRRDGVTPRELVHARADAYLAENALRAAEFGLQQAKASYERERARLDDMTIRSGIDGLVTGISVDPGEAVDELQAVIQVVSIDPLWIDVAVPVPVGLKIMKGSNAVVHWRDVRHGMPTDGTVLHVLPVAESASNSMIVRVEVPNPENMPSGLHVSVEFPDAEESLRRETERTLNQSEN